MSAAGRVVLATVGTLGDLHPCLALGAALQQSGLSVRIAAAPEYAIKARAARLDFMPLRPGRDEVLSHLGLDERQLAMRVRRDPRFLFAEVVLPHLEMALSDGVAAVEGASLVLSTTLAFGTSYAAEARGIGRLGIALQPLVFLSAFDPPRLPWLSLLSGAARRGGPHVARVLHALLRAGLAGFDARLNALRRRHGLPAIAQPLSLGQFPAAGTLALYSRVLGTTQPDFPPRTEITGFQFHDEPPADELRGRVSSFLARGAPPIVFTLGSFETLDPAAFFDTALAAVRAIGCRALFLAGGAAATLARHESDALLVCDYAPYATVFPHAAAIVHHGGVGTVAQALRAGVPQLVVPAWADQPDNAARVAGQGAGRVVPRSQWGARRASREIQRVLGDAGLRERARSLAAMVGEETARLLAVQRIHRELGV